VAVFSSTRLNAIWGSSASDIWAVGDKVLRYNGFTWSLAQAAGGVLNGVSGSSASNVWAVGDDGKIAHYEGAMWMTVPRLLTARLTGVWVNSPTDVWAVGANGVILHGRMN
jgi:hypothetical protein